MTLSELFGGDDMNAEERKFLEQAVRLWTKKHDRVIQESKKVKK
jgi:hypothetical protein